MSPVRAEVSLRDAFLEAVTRHGTKQGAAGLPRALALRVLLEAAEPVALEQSVRSAFLTFKSAPAGDGEGRRRLQEQVRDGLEGMTKAEAKAASLLMHDLSIYIDDVFRETDDAYLRALADVARVEEKRSPGSAGRRHRTS